MGAIIRYLVFFLLFSSGAWGADYFVRPGGNDNCDGTTDADGSSGACAFKTIGKAWVTSATVDANNTVAIRGGSEGSPATYSEGQSIGGADTGNTLTLNFDAHIIVKAIANTQTYVFRVGEASTTVTFNGQAGWPKTVEFDAGRDASANANVNLPMFYSNQAGTTINVNDIDYNAVGATSTARLLYATATTTANFRRCYINHFDTGLTAINSSGPILFEACFFEDCDAIRNIVTTGTGVDFIVRNNTFYDNNGTSNTNPIIIDGSGTNAYTIDVRNNLFISNAASATLTYFLTGQATDFTAFGGTVTLSNNAAWKTTTLAQTTRNINSYPSVLTATYGTLRWDALYNQPLNIDPDIGTLPAINATSLLIGRGANTGVTTDIAGTAYPSDSIGCYAVAGGTKQYLTPVSKKVLIAGHSFNDNAGGNVVWGTYLRDTSGISGIYDLVGHPGSTTQCSGYKCFAAYPGVHAYLIAGAYTELAQYHSPEWIFYNADGNSWRLYGAANWSATLETGIIKSTIDNLLSLYNGDVKIVYLGSPPDDSRINSSTNADAIETIMETYAAGLSDVESLSFLGRMEALRPGSPPNAAIAGTWGYDYFNDTNAGVHPGLYGKATIGQWASEILLSQETPPKILYVRADGTGVTPSIGCGSAGSLGGLAGIEYGAGATQITAGDTVIFCTDGGDTFYGAIPTLTTTGAVDAPIIFKANAGQTPIISGEATGLSWASYAGTTYRAAMTASSWGADTHPNRVFWGSTELSKLADKDTLTSNTYAHDGTYLYVDIGQDPTGQSIHAAKYHSGFNVGGNAYVTIDGLTFKYQTGSTVVASAGADHITIKNNTFFKTTMGIYTAGMSDSAIYDNLFDDYTALTSVAGRACHAVYLDDNSDSNTIYDNIINNGLGGGIFSNQDGSDNNIFHHNVATGNAAEFIQLAGTACAGVQALFNVHSGGTYFYLEGSDSHTTSKIVGNSAGYHSNMGISASGASSQLGAVKNNAFWGTKTSANIGWVNTPTSFTNNIVRGEIGSSDPLFISSSDLRLQPASPAVRGGAFVTGVHDQPGCADAAGIPCNSMAIPIGAYSTATAQPTYHGPRH